MSAGLGRRAWLGAVGCAAATLALPRCARALARTPLGGRITMRLPWPASGIDPHELRDPLAALFASAISDSVYALDTSGNAYPTLAAGMPAREGGDTVVRLREGLRSARGAALVGRDLVSSVERARARGGVAVLADVPVPRPHPSDPTAASFAGIDPQRLARALASPLLALLPRKFNAAAPDGTGAFRADASGSRLVLTRNVNAARGHAFLDGVDVDPAEDLKSSLRAFETGRDDVGWLGAGLFGERKGSVRFDLGKVGWIVLETGADAGNFGMPGEAQRLADALTANLADLGLGTLPRATGEAAWGGPPTELLVDEGCAHLVTIARTVGPVLSRAGHEVTVTPVSRAELGRRRARGKATLVVDVVRPVAPGTLGALLSLATAEDPGRARDIAKHPPKLAPNASPRTVTRTLRVGVLGELRVAGAVVPDVVIARSAGSEGWDLGASFRRGSVSPPAAKK